MSSLTRSHALKCLLCTLYVTAAVCSWFSSVAAEHVSVHQAALNLALELPAWHYHVLQVAGRVSPLQNGSRIVQS